MPDDDTDFFTSAPSAPSAQPVQPEVRRAEPVYVRQAQPPAVTTGPATLAFTPFSGKETRADLPVDRRAAAVRYNNPGAMWEGPSSRKFGAATYGILRDGNHIAYFKDPVHGAAAQLDLLASPKYANRPLIDVITEWSGSTGGAQNVLAYVRSLGLDPNTRITPELLKSPAGIALAKAQAHWESKGQFSLTDQQWQQAQDLAFGRTSQQSQPAFGLNVSPSRTLDNDLMSFLDRYAPQ